MITKHSWYIINCIIKMFDLLKQPSQHNRQEIKNKILSYLFLDKVNKRQAHISNANASLQDRIYLETLEAQIKSFDYEQQQNFSSVGLNKTVFCGYNCQRKAQFLCCQKYCDKHAIMCANQFCKCTHDHKRCKFIAFDAFCAHIISKLQRPISKQIQNYFQVKKVVYEHMANRISQERQNLRDWQQEIQTKSEKSLFLYNSFQEQCTICHAPKVVYSEKIRQDHQKCFCIPTKIDFKILKNEEKKKYIEICNKIHKNYSQMINYLDSQIDKLYCHKEYANLNSAQLLFVEFLKRKDYSVIEEGKKRQERTEKCVRQMETVSGSLIYQAIKQKQQKILDLKKFELNKVRQIWRCYSQKIFRLLVEGKAVNQLLYQILEQDKIQVQKVQEIINQIQNIIQSLSFGEKQLFTNRRRIKQFKNVQPSQLQAKITKCKRKKYHKVCIINDRYETAIKDIKVIQELSNFTNLSKLEIVWCMDMEEQAAIQILDKMPNLKELAFLCHHKNFSNIFIKKICQLTQLRSFFFNPHSLAQYQQRYIVDRKFISFQHQEISLHNIEQLLKLSKLSKLENIELSFPSNAKSRQIIKNLRSLRHLTLGYNESNQQKVGYNLIKQLYKRRQLRTISLIGLQVQSKEIDRIISNNSHLSTIIIKNKRLNKNINDETIECMTNLIQLQTLCVNNNQIITGKHLSKLNSLIMLEIQRCNKVSQINMKEALTNMHKLRYLNVNFNVWVDNDIFVNIQSCKQLQFLSISSTSISSNAFNRLEEFPSLKVLICNHNNIWRNEKIELTKYFPGITKLSICYLEDEELYALSGSCLGITHLDTKIPATKTLWGIKNLKVIKSQMDKDTEEYLRQQGIKTYRSDFLQF